MRKIPVGILGATGTVGQQFIRLLHDHPWFEITSLAASERSAGKTYSDAVRWIQPGMIPENVAAMTVQACEPNLPCRIVFSGLDASVAGEIEEEFAQAGYAVISNARNHRMRSDVPLLIPEVNPEHLALIHSQPYEKGCIITNPNCSTTGLVLALKPLFDRFGVQSLHVTTMQAVSGAGYPGVASLDIYDNVVPFIGGEEEKMMKEPHKLLGTLCNGALREAFFPISAHCHRVPVIDGHLESVSIRFVKKALREDIISALTSFTASAQEYGLPSAPENPIVYFESERFPQPRLHRDLGNGMTVSVGKLMNDAIFDWSFVVLVHNTIRGAAGGAILNAELAVKEGYIK